MLNLLLNSMTCPIWMIVHLVIAEVFPFSQENADFQVHQPILMILGCAMFVRVHGSLAPRSCSCEIQPWFHAHSGTWSP